MFNKIISVTLGVVVLASSITSAFADQLVDNISGSQVLVKGDSTSGQFTADSTLIDFSKITGATLALTLADDGEATTRIASDGIYSTINNSTNTVNGVRTVTRTVKDIHFFLDEELDSVQILFGNQTQDATIENGSTSFQGVYTVEGPTPVPAEDCNITVGVFSSCANILITDITYNVSGNTGENTVYVQLDDAALQEFKQTGTIDYTVSATLGDLSVKDATLNLSYAKIFASIPSYLIDENIAPGAKVSQFLEIGQTPNGRREHMSPSLNDYADVAGRMPASDGVADASGGLWKDGVVTEIPMSGCEPTASFCGSRALNVNNEGVVVGSSNSLFSQGLWGTNTLTVYYEHEFRWQYGAMEFIAGAGWEWGWSKDINEAGTIVGSGRADRRDINDYLVHGYVWANQSPTGYSQIGDYGQSSFANAINDSDQVTGAIQQGDNMLAYIWQDDQVSVIGHLGGLASEGEDINNASPTQVVGVSTTASGEQHAFYWDGMSAMVDMGTFGGTTSRARAISDAGQAIGYATLADGTSHGFVWQAGVMYDLNDYIDPVSGWVIVDAYDINAQGEILVRAQKAGANTYLLLSPPDTVRPVRPGTGGGIGRLDPMVVESLEATGNDSVNDSYGVTVDSAGNTFTAGFLYGSMDLDPGPGEDIQSAPTASPWSGSGNFVTKRSASGDYEWSVIIPGKSDRKYGVRGLTTDDEGNLIIVGSQRESVYSSQQIGFVSKYDTNGTLIWTGQFAGYSINNNVVTDAGGNIYVAGNNRSGYVDLDPGAGLVDSRATGNYIVKLDADGNYVWHNTAPAYPVPFYGAAGSKSSLAITPSGDLYLAGIPPVGTSDFDPGPAVEEKTVEAWNTTGYVAKFSSDGSYSSTRFYEASAQNPLTVRANAAGVYVAGANKLKKMDDNGSVIWETDFVGVKVDFALDSAGNVYLAGFYGGTLDFDPGTGEDLHTGTIFVSRFNSDGSYASTNSLTTLIGRPVGITVDANDNVYAAGNFGYPQSWFSVPSISTEDAILSADIIGLTDIWYAKFSAPAPDADVTVCPSGCDYSVIQDGIDAATTDNVVLVYYGTYNELVNLNKKITLKSWKGPGQTIIDATGLGGSAVTVGAGSTIEGFTIRGGSAVNGGGVYIGSGTVQNNVITENSASSYGGGVYVGNRGASGLIQNNIISNNTSDNYGGGFSHGSYTNVTMLSNTFTGNSSRYGGAAFLGAYSTLRFVSNVVKANSATYGGGVFVGSYSRGQVVNSLITENTANYGGGVGFGAYTSGQVINSTIVNNSDGIGIFSYSSPIIRNSIVWGNVGSQISRGYRVTNSIVQGGHTGEGNLDADPLFVDAANGDYHLMSGSPAIDTASDASVIYGATSDKDGNARPADGDGFGAGTTGDGSDYDMGAYEFQ